MNCYFITLERIRFRAHNEGERDRENKSRSHVIFRLGKRIGAFIVLGPPTLLASPYMRHFAYS